MKVDDTFGTMHGAPNTEATIVAKSLSDRNDALKSNQQGKRFGTVPARKASQSETAKLEPKGTKQLLDEFTHGTKCICTNVELNKCMNWPRGTAVPGDVMTLKTSPAPLFTHLLATATQQILL